MDIVSQIKEVAVALFKSALSVAPDQDGRFRMVMPFRVGGETKPLVVVGVAHGKIEDGSCVAVLNPDESLVDQITPGVGSHHLLLAELVAKRCDVALKLWIDAYREDGVSVAAQYVARKPQPAKFCVV